jgi:hypothetical protein
MTAGLLIRVDRFGQVQLVPSFVYVPSGMTDPDAAGVYPITTLPTHPKEHH